MSIFQKIVFWFKNLFKKSVELPGPIEITPKEPPKDPVQMNPLEVALTITGDFESDGDPWTAISGNFDGQGASLGILQWCYGQNSIQPLLKEAGQDLIKKYCPRFWREIWGSALINGVRAVEDWSLAPMKPELRALLGSEEFKKIQMRYCGTLRDKANLAAENLLGKKPNLQEFCFFFDMVVQSGGVSYLTKNAIEDAIARDGGLTEAKKKACRWAIETGDVNAVPSARKWMDDMTGRHDLLYIGYLRALRSNEQWQGNAFARRGTIAMGYGHVENEWKDFRKYFDGQST